MSSWQEKARGANQKTMEAIELVSLASRKTGVEQSKALEEAFKKYQEAWIQSMEAFNEGLKAYSEEQVKAYNELFAQMQNSVMEAFKKYREAWKV